MVIQKDIKNRTRDLNLRQSSVFKSEVLRHVSYCRLVVTGVLEERCTLPNSSIFRIKKSYAVTGRCRHNAHRSICHFYH